MLPFLEVFMVVQEIALLSVICVYLRRDRHWRQIVKNAEYQPQRLAECEAAVTSCQAEIIAIRDEIRI